MSVSGSQSFNSGSQPVDVDSVTSFYGPIEDSSAIKDKSWWSLFKGTFASLASCLRGSGDYQVVSNAIPNDISKTPPPIARQVSDIALQLLGFKDNKLTRDQINERKEYIDSQIQKLNSKPTGFFSIFNGMSKAEKTELKSLQAESSTLGNIQNYTNFEDTAKTTLAEVVKSKLPEDILSKLDTVVIEDNGEIVLKYSDEGHSEEAAVVADCHNLNSLSQLCKIKPEDLQADFEAALLKKIGTPEKTKDVAIPILSQMMREGVSASGNRYDQQLIFTNLGMNLIELNMQTDLNQLCSDLEISERVVYNQEEGIFTIGEQTFNTLDEVYEELSRLATGTQEDGVHILEGRSEDLTIVVRGRTPEVVKEMHEELANQHPSVKLSPKDSIATFNETIKPQLEGAKNQTKMLGIVERFFGKSNFEVTLEYSREINMEEDLNQLCRELKLGDTEVIYVRESRTFVIGDVKLSSLDEVYEKIAVLKNQAEVEPTLSKDDIKAMHDGLVSVTADHKGGRAGNVRHSTENMTSSSTVGAFFDEKDQKIPLLERLDKPKDYASMYERAEKTITDSGLHKTSQDNLLGKLNKLKGDVDNPVLDDLTRFKSSLRFKALCSAIDLSFKHSQIDNKGSGEGGVSVFMRNGLQNPGDKKKEGPVTIQEQYAWNELNSLDLQTKGGTKLAFVYRLTPIDQNTGLSKSSIKSENKYNDEYNLDQIGNVRQSNEASHAALMAKIFPKKVGEEKSELEKLLTLFMSVYKTL